MGDPRDKRRYKRAELKAQVDWDTDHNEYSGYTENISEGGVFIATASPLAIGEPLEVRIALATGEELVIRTRVAWLRQAGDEAAGGMGVQFVDLTDEVRDRIRKFVLHGDDQVLLWRLED
jgi:uncharacterized protein (TIGR02266 family)